MAGVPEGDWGLIATIDMSNKIYVTVDEAELVALRAEVELLKGVRADLNLVVDNLNSENERLRKIERAARAAVETQRATGDVRLTLLADVLEEVGRDNCP